MKIAAAIAGRRKSGARGVSMTTFFLQDPKYDLEIHHKDGLKACSGAILFKELFDQLLLSE